MSHLHNKQNKNICVWFFAGRSIGVTLLGLFALEYFYMQMNTEKTDVTRYLVMTKKSRVSEEMLSMYPDILIVYLNWKNIVPVSFLFLRSVLHANIFLYPPAFGRPPLAVRFFSMLLCRFNVNGDCIGYVMKRKWYDHIFYSTVLDIELYVNIFEAVARMFATPKKNSQMSPSLIFSYDSSYQESLPKKYIVFHPFAATEKRTYPDSLSKKLLVHLLDTYPEYTIIVSGGPDDISQARGLIEAVMDSPRIHFIEDVTGGEFRKKIQIISRADLYIGVDTGITHISAHLNTPTLVLGNRSNPMWLPEYAKDADILYNINNCTCTLDKKGDCRVLVDGKEYYRCMVEIPWQSITSAIKLRLG